MSDLVEEWRPVPDFSNYEISNHCRARNVKTGKMLKPVYDPACRYVRYCFRQDGRQLTKNAHRVMWRAFHGEIQAGLQLNHIDGNRQNNIMTNLELVTPSGNTKHAYDLGLIGKGDAHHSRLNPERMARGSSHGMAKLQEADAIRILERVAAGDKAKAIAKDFGITSNTVRDVGRKTWRHLIPQQH